VLIVEAPKRRIPAPLDCRWRSSRRRRGSQGWPRPLGGDYVAEDQEVSWNYGNHHSDCCVGGRVSGSGVLCHGAGLRLVKGVVLQQGVGMRVMISSTS
jgi:hypothetical protein